MTIPLSKAALAEINPPFDFDPANTKLVANASINTSVEQDLSQDLDLENTSSSDLFESKTPVLQSPGEPFPTSEQLIPFLHEGGLEISIAKTLSPVLAVISKILEKIYFVEVKDLTLTEKNKGGEYTSSGVSISTSLSVSVSGTSLLQKEYLSSLEPLFKNPFSLKGLRPSSLQVAYDVLPQAFKSASFQIESGTSEDWVAKNPDFREIVAFPTSQAYVEYAPLIAEVPEKTYFLNVLHETTYLSFFTKWMEHNVNFSSSAISAPEPYRLREREVLEAIYESFLLSVLAQYFHPVPVEG